MAGASAKGGQCVLENTCARSNHQHIFGLLPEVEGVSSKYWVDCKPQATNKASYDTDVARKLWEVSQELTGAPEGGEVPAMPAVQQASS